METHNCDSFLIKIWKLIIKDVGEYAALPDHFGKNVKTPAEVRAINCPNYIWSDISAYTVKCIRQIEQFFTRHRFNSDILDDHDLACTAYNKFVATQERLGRQDFSTLSASTARVVRRARRICREILREVPSDEEIYENGSFSKRATTWSPLSQSYLHDKLKLITGSPQHLSWFQKTNRNYMLADVLACNGSENRVADALTVSFVPKSWKTFRTVTPNTLIGSFHSYGVGKIIAERLRDVGLDIHTLQHRQRLLAQRASLTGKQVTADLSAASDSFTTSLINMLLPRKWFNLLKMGRIGTVNIVNPLKGKPGCGQKVKLYLSSFMAMGIGFTFPVQTLLFYALLRGIEEELECIPGTISVYGDDLIYPKHLHKYVPKVFAELGFLLNLDKSFAEGSFRESCGGDFYKGVDVRPAMVCIPPHSDSGLDFLSEVYKLRNALAARWADEELPSVFSFIEEYIMRHYGRIHVVPPSFPDYSGIKYDPVPSRFIDMIRVVPIKGRKRVGFDNPYLTCHYKLAFTCLKTVPRGKLITTEEMTPYLWLKLKLLQDPWIDPLWARSPDQLWLQKEASWRDRTPSYEVKDSNVLYWRTVKLLVRGKKIRKLRAYTSFKSVSNISETELSTMDWLA